MSPEEWLASQTQAEPAPGGSEVGLLEPPTTAQGLAGAATRGLALPVAGAVLGAAMGAPVLGVGAIPGAIAGLGAGAITGMVGDPVVKAVNSMLGTNYTLPTDALTDLLTRVGVPVPRTQAERIAETTAASAGLGLGGVAVGKALQASTGPVSRAVGEVMATTPGFQALTSATGGGAGQLAKEEGAGLPGQFGASVLGSLAPSVPALSRMGIGYAAKKIAPPDAGIQKQPAPTTLESIQSIKATIAKELSPQNELIIRNQLTSQPDSTNLVNFRLSGSQVIPDNEAVDAIAQGWNPAAIASIKNAPIEDLTAMRKMLNIFQMGDKSAVFKVLKRPADILGDTVNDRIKFLANANKQAGLEIQQVANSQLRNQPIDVTPAFTTFSNDLEALKIGVELNKKGVSQAVLKGSDIQGDKQAKRILDAVLERVSKDKMPDAYEIHNVKRFIDTQVDFGQRSLANPLTAQAERILKTFRRNLNLTLGEQYPDYRSANTKYQETIGALDFLQDSAGTKIDFKSPSASLQLGTAMRKLTSNYGTRASLIDALDQANTIATKYGMKIDDNIINQLIFVNELDRMFGAAAQTSLKGQQSEIATGIDIARGKMAEKAFELLAEKAQSLRGINKENAVKAMEALLKRQ